MWKEGKDFSVKPKNSRLRSVQQSLRTLLLGGSQNFTPCVSSDETRSQDAGSSLALQVSEQQWGEYLLGMLRKGDGLEDTAALQDFTF